MSFPSLIVMPVSNLESAKMVYSKLLDTDPYVDSAYYVGFHAGEGEIGLDPNGTGAHSHTGTWTISRPRSMHWCRRGRRSAKRRVRSEAG